MKKLMIVAAAALGMTAFADIESVNVVGYTETALQGFKMLTPSFKNITATTYPIDSFVVKGAVDTTVSVQVLDAAGQVKGMYYWFNEGGPDLPAGWFDYYGLESANVELNPGEAAFFYTDVEGASIVSAGEVPGEIKHNVSGFAMLGNGSPVAIDVDKMTVENSVDTTVSIQVLDAAGQVSGMYYWFNEGGPDLPAGWFDYYGLEPAGITLEAGESVLFYTDVEGATMTVPSALVK